MKGSELFTPPEAVTPYQCAVHNHTTFCDGKGTPEEMAAAAYRSGVRVLGFSGHSHTPLPLDDGYVMERDPAAYHQRVLALRDVYAGRMEVLLGIEWDMLSDGAREMRGNGAREMLGDGVQEGYDYWIGSVHHLLMDGRDCPVDYDPEHFAAACGDVFGGDALAFAERYYQAVGEMAAQRPTILGHFDLITKFNEGGRFFDETAPRYRQAALAALRCVDPSATLLEINTGAMSRNWRTAPYPAPFLLEEWRAMGGRVILTADAHSPETVVYGYAAAADAARAAGFTSAAVLTLAGVRECGI